MQILTLGAENFAYTLDGPAGAPVVMLANSLGTTMAMWDRQARFLQQRYRVLRYDTRGHGQSTVSTGPYALPQLGNDVLRLLDALAIEKVGFCGISMAGMTGMWLGIHAPSRLEKLVIANSAARIGTAEGWHARAQQVLADGMDGVADGAAGRWFTPAFIAQAPDQVAQYVQSLRDCSPAGYASCCQALAGADLREEIAAITTPTLLIAGLHDPVTTTVDARFMQSRIGDASYAELPASHLSNIEASEGFNRLLQDFLA
ncbi:Beta-ketoadipate enol-lactone hydrolase [Collimonas arenae]|uniref:Beta-ketoadipate enol-lactone hydrolase n=1 Tax=Collimonas arenae TaxID=279058 RepID=A0A0A1F464_9BURK|nr:3-oxoadipate enol-lactonase [Collimonas arenae]AIY39306.1 Beta-ketoadipate enol-lactone hydrolase [Collimonas arenae]